MLFRRRPVRFRLIHTFRGIQIGPASIQEAPSMRALRMRFRHTVKFRPDMERQGEFRLWCPGEEIEYRICR